MEAMLNSRLGRTILGATHVTIGCTSDNQVVLSETGVESRHAEIRPEGQGYSILDLGSGAGTFVNGQRLVPHIPQLLQNGDTIRIGNAPLSYEITSGPSIAPTVYAASPGQVSDSGLGYSPTVMAPGGAAASYGASGQSGDALYAPPPIVSPGYNLDDPYGSVTPKKRGRRGLWITLGAVVGVLVIAGSGSYDETLTNENGAWKINNEQVHSTPTVTLTTYCNALKQQDYQTAYNQLSSDNQSSTKEADFANGFSADKVTDCSVSNVDDNAGTGTISYTLADGKTGTADYTLVQENGIWKLKTEKFR